MATTSSPAAREQKRSKSPALVAVGALVLALLVLPTITAIGDIEEGGLADALWLLQTVLILAAFVGFGLAIARKVRARRTAS
jgi:hypothetical protein